MHDDLASAQRNVEQQYRAIAAKYNRLASDVGVLKDATSRAKAIHDASKARRNMASRVVSRIDRDIRRTGRRKWVWMQIRRLGILFEETILRIAGYIGLPVICAAVAVVISHRFDTSVSITTANAIAAAGLGMGLWSQIDTRLPLPDVAISRISGLEHDRECLTSNRVPAQVTLRIAEQELLEVSARYLEARTHLSNAESQLALLARDLEIARVQCDVTVRLKRTNYDTMTGEDFEKFLGHIFTHLGYSVELTNFTVRSRVAALK